MDGQGRGYEALVKCFTCPRERRADEPGWYFVDVPVRTPASSALRVFVCPRHYGHFAAPERARWSPLGAAETAAPAALGEWLRTHDEPAELPVAAVLAAGEGIASE